MIGRDARYEPEWMGLSHRVSLLEVSVVPGAIDWGIVKAVDVYLRHEAGERSVSEQLFTLRPDSVEVKWKVRLSHPARREVSYYTVNHLKDGRTRASAVVTTRRTTLVIDDAFQAALDIDFVPLYDPAQVVMVYADIHYEDVANNYARNERLRFEGESPQRQQLHMALLDGAVNGYLLTYTIVGTDRSLRRLPPVMSDATLVFVGETFNQ